MFFKVKDVEYISYSGHNNSTLTSTGTLPNNYSILLYCNTASDDCNFYKGDLSINNI